MANRLSPEKQQRILHLMVEGNSMRTITRLERCSINTVTRLLEYAGQAAIEYHDLHVRDLHTQRVQADEIWAPIYAKDRNVPHAKAAPPEAGHSWTWTALDADSKLMITWAVSSVRDGMTAIGVMDDLRERTEGRIQLTTDGLAAYPDAVEGAFGGNVDYAQLIKLYEDGPKEEARRYSPAACVGVKRGVTFGLPEDRYVSTSYVERSNLSMRMGMRRFTRLTNGLSKKYANHCYMIALYFLHYNFCRPHKTLNRGYDRTPAMAAGLADSVYSIEWLSGLVSAQYPVPGPRGPYRPRQSKAS